MAAPWAKYASTAPAGPWRKYAGTASVEPDAPDIVTQAEIEQAAREDYGGDVAAARRGAKEQGFQLPAPTVVKAPASYQIQAEETPAKTPTLISARNILKRVPAAEAQKMAPGAEAVYQDTTAPQGQRRTMALKPPEEKSLWQQVNEPIKPVAGALEELKPLMVGPFRLHQKALELVAPMVASPAGALFTAGVVGKGLQQLGQAGDLAQRGISGFFGYEGAKGLTELPAAAKEQLQGQDWATLEPYLRTAELGMDAGMSGLMAVGGTAHATQGFRPAWQAARAKGSPMLPPAEVTPAMRAGAEYRANSPRVQFENRLAELSDNDLALSHQGEANPYAKGLMAREIATRKRMNRWNPDSLKSPEPVANQVERRASVEPEQGPTSADFENAAWDVLGKPWAEATAEEQGQVRELVQQRWREQVGPRETMVEPDLVRVADELGLGDYSSLPESDKAVVRQLRDERANQVVDETKPPTAKTVQANGETNQAVGETSGLVPETGEESRPADLPALTKPERTIPENSPNPWFPVGGSESTLSPEEAARLRAPETPYQIVGPHGPIHTGLEGKWREARDLLDGRRAGEAPDVFQNPKIGKFGMLWGERGQEPLDFSDGYGLAKIKAKHPSAWDELGRVNAMDAEWLPIRQQWNLHDEKFQAVVRETWDGKKKRFLLTEFERKPELLPDRTSPMTGDRGEPDEMSPSPRSSSVSNLADPSPLVKPSAKTKTIEQPTRTVGDYSPLRTAQPTVGKQKRTTVSDYLSEKVSYGGLETTRGEMIADLQSKGATKEQINAYLGGRALRESLDKGREGTERAALKSALRPRDLPPPDKPAPEKGSFAAIRTDDGSIYWEPDTPGSTHYHLARRKNVPPERIVGGGFIVDGDYRESPRSDSTRLGERARASLQAGKYLDLHGDRAALRAGESPESHITAADIRRAFPRAKTEQLEDGRFRVEVGGGREVIVEPGLEGIQIAVETVRRDYGRDPLPGEQAVGRYVRIDRDGLIQLSRRGGDAEILNHETFHAAVDLVLTEHEKGQLLKKWGTEEAAAEAYSKLKAEEPTGLLFAKIRAFFQRIWDNLSGKKNTAEGVMRQIARGDVWSRENVPADIKAIKPTGTGPLGPIYPQFQGNAQGAIAKLMYERSGFAPAVFRNPQVGEIGLAWGDASRSKSLAYGAAKKLAYHPEVLPHLQKIVEGATVREVPLGKPFGTRIELENGPFTIVVKRGFDEVGTDQWVATAFFDRRIESSASRGPASSGTHAEAWTIPPQGDSPTNRSVARRISAVKPGPDPTERFAMRAEPLGLLEPDRPGRPPAQESTEPSRTEEPRRLIVSPNVEKSYENIAEKSGLSKDGQLRLIDSIGGYLRANPERKVMTDADYRRMAKEVVPEDVYRMDPSKIEPGKLPPREVMEAARAELDRVTNEISELTKKQDGPMLDDDRNELDARLNRLENDQNHLINLITLVRSEHGRNLRMWGQMALQDLDPAAWIARARRDAGLKGGVALPGDVEAAIKDALTQARNAEADAVREVTTIERGRQKLAEGVQKYRERQQRVIELTPEQKLEQARKREIARLKGELDGKRLRNALTEEQRQELATDPEIQRLRELVHEQRAKSKPVKPTEERVAAAIERERKRLSRRLEGEETGARPDKLTDGELRQVGEDPVVQSLRARIQQRLADDRAAKKLAVSEQKKMLAEAAAMPEAVTSRAIEAEVNKADRATAKEIGVLETPPKTKRDLTPEQQSRVNRDPRVIAARRRLFEAMKVSQKQSKWEVASAVRRAGLLTAAKTWMRNIGGNTAFATAEEVSRIPASVLDAAIGVFTHRRTVQGLSIDAMRKAGYQAATKGVEEFMDVMRQGVTNEQLEKYDFHRELNSGSAALDTYVNGVMRLMSAQDRVFKRYALERSLQEQMTLAGVDMPSEVMIAQAIADAEFATFNNRNQIAQAWSSVKANRSAPVRFAMDMVVPFSQTPSNVVLRGLDYTPIGAIGRTVSAAMKAEGLTPEFQRAISLAFGRGLVGSALLLAGYAMAKNRRATGNRPQNPSEARADEVARRPWGAVKVGGTWLGLSAISPIGALITTGAALYEAEHDRETGDADQQAGKRMAAAAGAVAKVIADMPMLQGVGMTKDLIDKPFSASRIAGRMVGSFVPTAVADLSAMADPARREAKGFTDSIMQRTPARMLLPEKIDALGRVVPQDRLALVDPFLAQKSEEDSDPLLQAIVDEQMTFGQPPRRDGESDEAYRWRLKVLGAARDWSLRQAMKSDEYQQSRSWRQGSDERHDLLKKWGDKAADALTRSLGRDYTKQPPPEQLRRIGQAAAEFGVR